MWPFADARIKAVHPKNLSDCLCSACEPIFSGICKSSQTQKNDDAIAERSEYRMLATNTRSPNWVEIYSKWWPKHAGALRMELHVKLLNLPVSAVISVDHYEGVMRPQCSQRIDKWMPTLTNTYNVHGLCISPGLHKKVQTSSVAICSSLNQRCISALNSQCVVLSNFCQHSALWLKTACK